MDNDANLLAFQGILISSNIEFPFSRIQHRGGNENNILNITSKVYSYLLEKKFINCGAIVDDSKHEMKKYFLYMVLNSDIPALSDMVDQSGVDHIVWNIQTIPHILLCDLVFGLQMEIFIEDAISMTNPKLGLDIFKLFTNYVKYLKMNNFQNHLKSLVIGGFKMLINLIVYDTEKLNINGIAFEVLETLCLCLNFFLAPPDINIIEQLKGTELYKYQGDIMKTILESTKVCLYKFQSSVKLDFDERNLYSLTISKELVKDTQISGIFSDIAEGFILEVTVKFFEVILDKIANLLTLVDVNVFCCWSEIEKNGKTLQEEIRQLSHDILLSLRSIVNLQEHEALHMLKCTFGEPIKLIDKINASNDETLIQNAKIINDDQKEWLHGIINKENFLKNIDFVNTVSDNMDVDVYEKVFEICSKCILEGTDVLDEAKTLAVKSFALLEDKKQIESLKTIFSDELFHDKFETALFEDKSMEIFNKIVTTETNNFKDVLTVLIQNPRKTFEKIVNRACENKQQTYIMINVLNFIQAFSNYKYENEDKTLELVVKNKLEAKIESETVKLSLVSLFKGLKDRSLMNSEKILNAILTNMHPVMTAKDLPKLSCLIGILNFYNSDELSEIRAPVLAMLGQVMDVVRWECSDYCADAVTLLEDTIAVQTRLVNSYNGIISDRDKDWLKSKIALLKPHNMFYFRSLWNSMADDYLEVVTGSQDITTSSGVLLLLKLLISSTPREWMEVYHSLSKNNSWAALATILKAVILLTVAEDTLTMHVKDYCFSNFAALLKLNFTENDSEETARQSLKMIAELTNTIKDEEQLETATNTFLPLISFIGEKKPNFLTQFDCKSEFKNEKFCSFVQDVVKNALINAG